MEVKQLRLNLIRYCCLCLLFLFSQPTFAASEFWPTGAEWRQSIVDAAYSPATWVPLLGAAIVAATNTDTCITKWATTSYPIFGSQKNAETRSDEIKNFVAVSAVASLFLMPQRDPEKSWAVEKGQYFLVMSGAIGTADGIAGSIKSAVKRTRPNGHSRSFPSGHTTAAFASAAVLSRNIDAFNISRTTNIIAQTGTYILASSVGLARIEAKAHWTTDVLVGAAIGNFISSSIYNAFMNKPKNDRIFVTVNPYERGFYFNIDKEFD